jgi:catechol 2,3-dioxygenase-like lactoylglutathione lyase family enzyme
VVVPALSRKGDEMAVRATSHVAIGVHDMDRALRFYRDLLGLRVAVDREECFADASTDPPAERRRRAVYLRWADGPDDAFVVLDQQHNVIPGAPKKLFQIGVHHVAFWVDDIEPYMAEVANAGGHIAYGPNHSGGEAYGEAPGSRVRTVLFHDPEGNIVQLDQRLPGVA